MGGFSQGIGNLVRGEKMFTGMLPDASKGGFFKARNPFKPEPRDPISMTSQGSTSTPPVNKPAVESPNPVEGGTEIGANIDSSNATILDSPAIPKNIKLADYTTDGSFFKKPEITLDAARKYLTASGTPINK